MTRSFTNVLSDTPDRTATFYEELLGMTRHFDSDWFVILTHPGVSGLEFGILQRDHDVVPQAIRSAPAGVILTFVVDDLAPVVETAQRLDAEIVDGPTRMPYGQMRLLLRDPDGTVIDVSCPN
mgnify:FL=1